MMENVETDVKIKRLASEASALLMSYRYEEAWAIMGELNALLKLDGSLLGEENLEELRKSVGQYFYQEKKVITPARRRLTGIGYRMSEIVDMMK